jgi:hypothetical protein
MAIRGLPEALGMMNLKNSDTSGAVGCRLTPNGVPEWKFRLKPIDDKAIGEIIDQINGALAPAGRFRSDFTQHRTFPQPREANIHDMRFGHH